MALNSAARAYSQVNRDSQGMVASPTRLILMLMDGALAQIGAGEAAIKQSLFEKKAESLTKAIDIVAVLRASLDFDKGGKIAKNLSNVYEFVERTLLLVIAHNDLSKLAECRNNLQTVREGWVQIVDKDLPESA